MAKLFTSKTETVIVGTVVVLGGGEGPIVNPDNSQRSRVAGTKSMESNTPPNIFQCSCHPAHQNAHVL